MGAGGKKTSANGTLRDLTDEGKKEGGTCSSIYFSSQVRRGEVAFTVVNRLP